MIFLENKDLTGCPHKTSNRATLFDFIEKRVNISLCERKFVFNPSFKMMYF